VDVAGDDHPDVSGFGEDGIFLGGRDVSKNNQEVGTLAQPAGFTADRVHNRQSFPGTHQFGGGEVRQIRSQDADDGDSQGVYGHNHRATAGEEPSGGVLNVRGEDREAPGAGKLADALPAVVKFMVAKTGDVRRHEA